MTQPFDECYILTFINMKIHQKSDFDEQQWLYQVDIEQKHDLSQDIMKQVAVWEILDKYMTNFLRVGTSRYYDDDQATGTF